MCSEGKFFSVFSNLTSSTFLYHLQLGHIREELVEDIHQPTTTTTLSVMISLFFETSLRVTATLDIQWLWSTSVVVKCHRTPPQIHFL